MKTTIIVILILGIFSFGCAQKHEMDLQNTSENFPQETVKSPINCLDILENTRVSATISRGTNPPQVFLDYMTPRTKNGFTNGGHNYSDMNNGCREARETGENINHLYCNFYFQVRRTNVSKNGILGEEECYQVLIKELNFVSKATPNEVYDAYEAINITCTPC